MADSKPKEQDILKLRQFVEKMGSKGGALLCAQRLAASLEYSHQEIGNLAQNVLNARPTSRYVRRIPTSASAGVRRVPIFVGHSDE